MTHQTIFHLSAKRRGCHLITREVMEHLPKPLPQVGLLSLIVQHTSYHSPSTRIPIRMCGPNITRQ